MVLSSNLVLEPAKYVKREQQAAISLDHLFLSYPVAGEGEKVILCDINLQIEAGEFVVVLGQTGCGKSTLLRLILGQERPTQGQVSVNGRVVNRIDSSCAYVPQRYSLFPDRTVLENLTLGPEMSQFHLWEKCTPRFYAYRRKWRTEALEQLFKMGLQSSDSGKYPHQLSGGMQQRVAIAQALMMQPSVLLMDEAFSALDPATRSTLQRLLREVWSERKPTILFVTHNTAEALVLGTRLIVLGHSKNSNQHGSKIVLDMKIPFSNDPISQRGQGKEFMDLLEYVERHSRGHFEDRDELSGENAHEITTD